MKNWLKDFNYPNNVINQSLYNAKLQGPAPSKDKSKKIPFIATYFENRDNEEVFKKIVLNGQIFNQGIFQNI